MHPIYNAFVYIVWLFATYFTVFYLLSLFVFKDDIHRKKSKIKGFDPYVSIIVPAFNEERDIASTISSLKVVNYKKVEFIIINDGSRDNTSEIVRENIEGDKRFTFIDNSQNKGKAACLNQGISQAKGELVACMDADSVIEPDIIKKTLSHFDSEKVGAVTVSVEVKDPKGFLHKVLQIEYALGLSLFLKIFSYMDCVFVTPGPFSIFRKSMLDEIGGFDKTNITEDLEIAYRIHKSGYQIRNCIEAKVSTTLPATFKGIYVQRKRWYSGALKTLHQHKDVIFNRKYGLFGFFMPFNYFLIIIGLALFGASIYLGLSNIIEELLYFRYTGFNFLDHFKLDIDLLNYSRINLLGMSMFLATLFIMFFGIYVARKRYRDFSHGMIGYPLLFLLYQLYWIGAIWAIVRKRKIIWR